MLRCGLTLGGLNVEQSNQYRSEGPRVSSRGQKQALSRGGNGSAGVNRAGNRTGRNAPGSLNQSYGLPLSGSPEPDRNVGQLLDNCINRTLAADSRALVVVANCGPEPSLTLFPTLYRERFESVGKLRTRVKQWIEALPAVAQGPWKRSGAGKSLDLWVRLFRVPTPVEQVTHDVLRSKLRDKYN